MDVRRMDVRRMDVRRMDVRRMDVRRMDVRRMDSKASPVRLSPVRLSSVRLSSVRLSSVRLSPSDSRPSESRPSDSRSSDAHPSDAHPSDPSLSLLDLSVLHLPHRLEYKKPSIIKGRRHGNALARPVVWESTFDPELLDAIFKPQNLTIAATVFAVGKYIQFLKDFLETSERFFFVGYNVHIYIFTDRPNEVPKVQTAPGRKVSVRVVPSSKRWQEISARRMEMVHGLLQDIRSFTHFIFCLDVDSKYYLDPRSRFPYERRPESRAYMAPSDGDFYYCGGAFGGSLTKVLEMTQVCSKNYRDDEKDGIEAAWQEESHLNRDDEKDGIEAAWQEESHLNRYFWENKPSKVLSPEYLWQDFKS
ncbi:hypothetical protein WMY93_034017 [Mugilogobius chulae]|uniref:Uncharacterized protein n=1 Tax=Mugilogobius chulae TaxID=88201 RepID=A0AAW0MFJ8_9GOBI